MPPFEILAIFAAGLFAGTINTVVGSGTLVTFPTLLFFGYPPIVANVSNNVGLVPGGISGAWGYRSELKGHAATVWRLLPMSLVGGIVGAVLLLLLPPSVFEAVVPLLIGLAVLLVIFGPWLQRQAALHHPVEEDAPPTGHGARGNLLRASMFACGIYGGYFGAAQGVLVISILSVLTTDPLQRLNAMKNVLVTVVNGVAVVVFLLVAFDQIDWQVVAILATGSMLGGAIGARVGRRLSPTVLRALIVVIGVVAMIHLLAF